MKGELRGGSIGGVVHILYLKPESCWEPLTPHLEPGTVFLGGPLLPPKMDHEKHSKKGPEYGET